MKNGVGNILFHHAIAHRFMIPLSCLCNSRSGRIRLRSSERPQPVEKQCSAASAPRRARTGGAGVTAGADRRTAAATGA